MKLLGRGLCSSSFLICKPPHTHPQRHHLPWQCENMKETPFVILPISCLALPHCLVPCMQMDKPGHWVRFACRGIWLSTVLLLAHFPPLPLQSLLKLPPAPADLLQGQWAPRFTVSLRKAAGNGPPDAIGQGLCRGAPTPGPFEHFSVRDGTLDVVSHLGDHWGCLHPLHSGPAWRVQCARCLLLRDYTRQGKRMPQQGANPSARHLLLGLHNVHIEANGGTTPAPENVSTRQRFVCALVGCNFTPAPHNPSPKQLH